MSERVPRIGFVSLGCPKALVDTEIILSRLRAEGYRVSPDYEGADLVIVNTCGFLNEAVEESLEAVSEALQENGRVIVTGCLGSRKNPDGSSFVSKRIPGLIGVTGPGEYDRVLSLVHENAPRPDLGAFPEVSWRDTRLTPCHYAYLKIAEGCDNKCTFCIIPQLRGPLVSRKPSDILEEAWRLKEAGVKELMVVSQDTPAYGRDVRYAADFYEGRAIRTHILDLCGLLGDLGMWIRLHYVYPYPQVDRLVELMAKGKVLPYLDVPLQHAHPRVLKAMKRPGNPEKTLEQIKHWREICPEITIRSTFIAGFPGETEEEFKYLLDFIREAKLDRVGCFAYSPVDGAAANSLYPAVPQEIRQERQRRFMELQSRISEEKLKEKIGTLQDVIIDEPEDEDGVAVGRTKGDAPEIDGVAYVTTSGHLGPGDIVRVRITRTEGPDLVGKAL